MRIEPASDVAGVVAVTRVKVEGAEAEEDDVGELASEILAQVIVPTSGEEVEAESEAPSELELVDEGRTFPGGVVTLSSSSLSGRRLLSMSLLVSEAACLTMTLSSCFAVSMTVSLSIGEGEESKVGCCGAPIIVVAVLSSRR